MYVICTVVFLSLQVQLYVHTGVTSPPPPPPKNFHKQIANCCNKTFSGSKYLQNASKSISEYPFSKCSGGVISISPKAYIALTLHYHNDRTAYFPQESGSISRAFAGVLSSIILYCQAQLHKLEGSSSISPCLLISPCHLLVSLSLS